MGVLCLFIANVSLTLCPRRLQHDLGCIRIPIATISYKEEEEREHRIVYDT